MNKKLRIFSKSLSLSTLSLLFIACAVHRDNYRDKENSIFFDSNSREYTSIFSIANAGAALSGPNDKLLDALTENIVSFSKEDDYLLFLGDNVHNSNLEDSRVASQLDAQLSLSKSFKGTSLFLTGEQEWNERGVEGLEDIETYIEDFYKEEDHFLPKNGCPLEVISVNDEIELILINSQWYIEDWSKTDGINDKCELKTRTQFNALLASEMRKARHKAVLIAMHHPLYSNGIYGGEIPSSVVYKPTSENAFIPLAGASWSFLRSQGGLSKQDRYNPLMNELMSTIELAAFDVPKVIIVSGHERSLQYIDHGAIKQVISGTGSSVKPARLSKRGLFTSTKPGYTEVRIYEDNSSSVHFFTLQDGAFKEAFSQRAFKQPEPYNLDSLPTVFPKTVKASVYPAEAVKKSEKYEKFWGKHYRYVYGVEIEAPVVLLDTLYGGLTVERAGGGNQTNGLRLVTKDDKEYNMRAIAKDPIAFLKSAGYNDLDADDYFAGTVPATIIQDFYTAAHPYGAFAIPRLAGAIKLPHTHPKLFYVPKQKALGDFNKVHGDQLYMIVEKPDGDFDKSHMFKFSKEVESTQDLFKELREDEQHKLDERTYIRARIFDMLIGDWDRHEDQWRWAQNQVDEEEGVTIYSAVPRDRDQVFAKFDGEFLTRMQSIMSGMRQFGNYGPDIPYIEQFSESAINLDRSVVLRSNKSVWLEEVAYIQQHITPDVISKAFSEAPMEIQDNIWKGIQADLLARKDRLDDIVDRYYNHFLKFQVLKGTDKDDHFDITNLDNGDVHIMGYRIKDGEKGALLFDRTFSSETTNDIWIYGLDDKDIFNVQGLLKSPINIVLSGGLDNDSYTIEGGKNVTLYDQKSSKNNIINKGKATRHIDDIYENRIFDTERRPDNAGSFALQTSYNPDEGITPSFKFSKSTIGFEGNPFTTKFELDARYISLTQAADVRIAWHKAHLFHDWNFKVFGRATTANFTENFFGLGNSSTNESRSFDDNRINTQYLMGGVGLYYNGEYGTSTGVNITYENIDTVFNNEPLITAVQYLGVSGYYNYHSIDNEHFPTRGMEVSLKGGFLDELTNTNTVGIIDPSISLWNAIDRSRNLVIKTTVTSQLRFGDKIPFYKAATLGANNGLRSYRQSRFIGQQSLAGSVDIAYLFKPIKTAFFPIRIDTYAGYDTGGVWSELNESNTLHYSYGGGLNVSTAGALKGTLSYFNGPEGGRLGFGISLGL
ncbi:hypothetical protein JM84_1756 [Dokdonia sp. Hel_I_63]|uniref:hypothetical protein n=1 Tax=Dokdonia sp. Hel_I_63 TaxID=1249996 RepID=UPI001199E0B6|nr:hypothetical protein [Dokdonia sp. Hel_I_63]TVZ22843.1 hypothetical protein JM84_1756 [Dokdonia sp. Hel_I_63]